MVTAGIGAQVHAKPSRSGVPVHMFHRIPQADTACRILSVGALDEWLSVQTWRRLNGSRSGYWYRNAQAGERRQSESSSLQRMRAGVVCRCTPFPPQRDLRVGGRELVIHEIDAATRKGFSKVGMVPGFHRSTASKSTTVNVKKRNCAGGV